MMTAAGAIYLLLSIIEWCIYGTTTDAAFPLFLGLPFLAVCILADVGVAVGMVCIEKITKSGEAAIIKARMNWRNR